MQIEPPFSAELFKKLLFFMTIYRQFNREIDPPKAKPAFEPNILFIITIFYIFFNWIEEELIQLYKFWKFTLLTVA